MLSFPEMIDPDVTALPSSQVKPPKVMAAAGCDDVAKEKAVRVLSAKLIPVQLFLELHDFIMVMPSNRYV